jgi:hypothetical protein
MDSLKNLQLIRIAMLASVVFYPVIATLVPASGDPNPIVFYAFTGIAIAEVAAIFVMRRALLSTAQPGTMPQLDTAKLSMRPRIALIVIYCLSEAVALYGLVLHFLGFSLSQVAPFFVAGFVLLFFFEPQLVIRAAA